MCQNRPILLDKRERQTSATATVAAVLAAVIDCPKQAKLRCIILNNQIFENITKKLIIWDSQGFTGVKDASLYKALLSQLRSRKAPTIFGKATPQDKQIRKEVNALARDASEMEGPTDKRDTSANPKYLVHGVRLAEMTQALAYKAIKEMTLPKPRPGTEITINKIQNDIQEARGTAPVPEILWKAIRDPLITRRARNFLYIALHGALRIGKYWKHIPACEDRANCTLCNTEESLSHILFECKRPWRKMIWDIVKDLWLKSDEHATWEEPTLGTTLGCCSIPAPSQDAGENNPTQDRLYRILIIEAVHCIWKLRCEIVIDRENEDATLQEVHGRWAQVLNKRLERDQKLISKRWKKDMIPKTVVFDTWNAIVQKTTDLPPDWIGETGVLVGIRPYTDFG
ncbi:hypothetical protein EV360DRAFT_56643 [Lentinula raphanica]|nr:hypothetical protein EV360DRAFT_56643 [Lentinula raphanica]